MHSQLLWFSRFRIVPKKVEFLLSLQVVLFLLLQIHTFRTTGVLSRIPGSRVGGWKNRELYLFSGLGQSKISYYLYYFVKPLFVATCRWRPEHVSCGGRNEFSVRTPSFQGAHHNSSEPILPYYIPRWGLWRDWSGVLVFSMSFPFGFLLPAFGPSSSLDFAQVMVLSCLLVWTSTA